MLIEQREDESYQVTLVLSDDQVEVIDCETEELANEINKISMLYEDITKGRPRSREDLQAALTALDMVGDASPEYIYTRLKEEIDKVG